MPNTATLDLDPYDITLDEHDVLHSLDDADKLEADAIARYVDPLGDAGLAHNLREIDARRDLASTDSERAVLDAEATFEAARFAVWRAEGGPADGLQAAEADFDRAYAAWLEADRIAREYTEWLRDLAANPDPTRELDVVTRALAQADAYDSPEYRAAQARIEAGRRRAKDEGGRLYLEELGGFGLFDPSLAGDLETLAANADHRDLVSGILGRGELAILFGDSYTGKSFVALDWGLCIAHGVPWLGRPVVQGKVLYVAMEGAATLHKRELAWSAHRHLPLSPRGFTAYPRVVNLMHEASVSALAGFIERERFDLVVIDTLSRSLNGADENSSAEMGAYVSALSRIKEAHDGCSVLAIHHSRKDNPEVMRGSGALFAGVDRVLCWRIDSKGGDERKLLTQKDKSGEAAKPLRAAFCQVAPSAVLVRSEGDGGSLVMALTNLINTQGTVMRSDFQQRLVADGLKPSIDAARMAVKREIEAGRMHEAGGALLLGRGD